MKNNSDGWNDPPESIFASGNQPGSGGKRFDYRRRLNDTSLAGINQQSFLMQSHNMSDPNQIGMQNPNMHIHMQPSNMQPSNMQPLNIQNSSMQSSNIQSSNMQNSNMQNSNMQNSNMQNSNRQNLNMQNSNMQNSNIRNSNMRNSNMQNSNMQEQDMNMHNFNMNMQNASMGMQNSIMNMHANFGASSQGYSLNEMPVHMSSAGLIDSPNMAVNNDPSMTMNNSNMPMANRNMMMNDPNMLYYNHKQVEPNMQQNIKNMHENNFNRQINEQNSYLNSPLPPHNSTQTPNSGMNYMFNMNHNSLHMNQMQENSQMMPSVGLNNSSFGVQNQAEFIQPDQNLNENIFQIQGSIAAANDDFSHFQPNCITNQGRYPQDAQMTFDNYHSDHFIPSHVLSNMPFPQIDDTKLLNMFTAYANEYYATTHSNNNNSPVYFEWLMALKSFLEMNPHMNVLRHDLVKIHFSMVHDNMVEYQNLLKKLSNAFPGQLWLNILYLK